jgi:acetyl-CoA C-acetyltransferase
VSKVCLSGIQALIMADQFIRTGDLHTVIAGGQESMSQAPRLLANSRAGLKYGQMALYDHMQVDGLEDAYDHIAMGLLTEQHNDREPINRADMDEFALESHARALRAWKAGLFADEVIGASGPEGAVLDEGIRDAASLSGLTSLRPAFRSNGSITAGNASPISDGACALVVMSRERAESAGLPWLAEVGSHGMVAGPDTSLQDQPANAIARACEREGIAPSELDLVEINEAFAAVPLASARKLGIGLDRVNVNGGAIALGHPIGMSGARIVLHLVLELQRRGGGVGAAALCGGGGQGDALIVRVPKN